MKRTCCTYSTLPPLPTLPGQAADSFPPFTPAPVLERMYTVHELTTYLRLGQRPILTAISEGRLTSSFVGRQHLVSESSLAAFLKHQEGASPYSKKPNVETK